MHNKCKDLSIECREEICIFYQNRENIGTIVMVVEEHADTHQKQPIPGHIRISNMILK